MLLRGAGDTRKERSTRSLTGRRAASDLIPHVLCTGCSAFHLGSYKYWQSCKHPAHRDPSVLPRTGGAPVKVVDSSLH